MIFFYFHTGSPSYYPRPRGPIIRKGKSSNLKIGCCRGVSVPGAFKLDHLQPGKPLLSLYFSNFSTFILGAHSYYPRGPIMRKGKSSNLKIGWDKGFPADLLFLTDPIWGFQNKYFVLQMTMINFIPTLSIKPHSAKMRGTTNQQTGSKTGSTNRQSISASHARQ